MRAANCVPFIGALVVITMVYTNIPTRETVSTEIRDDMHVVLLAIGSDMVRSQALNMVRGIMLASDAADAITFHVLSDTWGNDGCVETANSLLQSDFAFSIVLYTLPASVENEYVNWTVWKNEYGPTPLADAYHNRSILMWKLLVPFVLPTYIKQVVVMDTDIFVQSRIQELWSVFADFREHQIYAMALEQAPVYAECFARDNWTAQGIEILPGYGFPGFNSGVTLVDLQRLRQSEEMLSLFRNPHVLFERMDRMRRSASGCDMKGILGDQDIINTAVTM